MNRMFVIYFTAVRSVDGMIRGDYYKRVSGLNWLHAVDRFIHSLGEDREAVRIETVYIQRIAGQNLTFYDREQ